MPRPIPRRTSEIELWDVNPVGTRDAWRRELLQFWSLMLTRGRRVRAPGYLMVAESTGDVRRTTNRSLSTRELATLLVDRIRQLPGGLANEHRLADLGRWLEASVIVPGERQGKIGGVPAAGLYVANYSALAAFNRAATRERFWAAFLFSALKTDLDVADLTCRDDLAGEMLDQFLSTGLDLLERPSVTSARLPWSVDMAELAAKDPEVLLAARALTIPAAEGIPDVSSGLPEAFFARATITPKGQYERFLCPGSVVLLRRALKLVLGSVGRVGHAALSEMIETVMVNHAALYFLAGMRVLNGLTSARRLPGSCATCWDRFQADVAPATESGRSDRWASGDYRGEASAEDAAWIERHCDVRPEVFVNAGRKEQASAKELACLSLEDLRRQLATYTVNRIMLSICLDLAGEVAGPLGQKPPGLDEVLGVLDSWSDRNDTRMTLAVLWRQRIERLATDPDVPGAVLERLEADLAAASSDPRQLEGLARVVVSEAILSSRPFTRYIELMNSLLGGGALPTNQDPKGLLARGGNRATPFHVSLNDRALEAFVAIATLEAEQAGQPLSFQGFVDFLATRYGLVLDRPPTEMKAMSGLVAEAVGQSREALRGRLRSMGFLDEFSDSSDWNRVHWRATVS